jgi:hypothetical protein
MSYQIQINRQQYNQSVDMSAIRTACAAYLADDQNPHGNDYEGEEIWVEFGTVGDAVVAINALGYTTDEDESDNDE